MDKKIAANLVVTIRRKITEWKFLVKHSVDKNDLNQAYSQVSFYHAILGQVSDKDYSCKRTCESFAWIVKAMFKDRIQEDFLEDAYKYTLLKAFPESVHDHKFLYPKIYYELFLKTLEVVNNHQKNSDDQTFMSVYPFELLTQKEINALEHPQEYKTFKEAFESQYIYEMMKLNYEVGGHSTIEHILGVHFLAMHIGRQLRDKGIPIDLGRVSGAAAGHDIGKFGCRPEENHKIAYYHYYYTYHWFTVLGIEYIKQVAVYHSTWDLEIESLSVESLVLIYSDFCVKRHRDTQGVFSMKFLSIKEAFNVIMDKLDALDLKKKRRYEKVFLKLKNFDEFMRHLGLCLEINNYKKEKDFILFPESPDKIQINENDFIKEDIHELRFKAIDTSIRMMHLLRDEWSLTALLQNASGQRDTQKFRRYLYIFEEYSRYLTPHQKLITLNFLSDYMIHPEEDIRKTVSLLMGKLLAMYDENYTKELPERAAVTYTMERKLQQYKTMMDDFIFGRKFITHIKKERQVVGHLYFTRALYDHVKNQFKDSMTDVLIDYLSEPLDSYSKDFFLQVIDLMPKALMTGEKQEKIVCFLKAALEEDESKRLMALKALEGIINGLKAHNIEDHYCKDVYQGLKTGDSPSESYLISKIKNTSQVSHPINYDLAKLFLSNLKTDTHRVKKIIHVEMLLEYNFKEGGETYFYIAMHFCNLLKVSAYELVRHKAGEALVKIFEKLSNTHQNDIVIELLRALEIEGFGFTKYIPEYLGQLIVKLSNAEYEEILSDMAFKVDNGSLNVQVLILETLKTMLQTQSLSNISSTKPMVAIIFKGLYNNRPLTRQVAFEVLCKGILGNLALILDHRYEVFKWIYKKLNGYVKDFNVFYNTSILEYAMGMHYIYHFMNDCEFANKDMKFSIGSNIVIYSGTFDPFSLGQKALCLDLVDQGYEVYVNISEFHWKRRTQASLIRRQMVEMSLADTFGIYVWPQSHPLNLSVDEVVSDLQSIFSKHNLYLATGEEALLNDQFYGNSKKMIYKVPHIIYKRNSMDFKGPEKEKLALRKSQFDKRPIERNIDVMYESINVNRIRKNIDRDWDELFILDDLVSQFIESKRLYKNEPQFKETLDSSPVILKNYEDLNQDLCLELLKDFEAHFSKCKDAINLDACQLLTLRQEETKEILAYAIYYIGEEDGKTLYIEDFDIKIVKDPHSLDQIILTETLCLGIKKACKKAVVSSCDLKADLYGVLVRSGFKNISTAKSKKIIFQVNMTAPVILNLDGSARMKEDFRQSQNVSSTVHWARSNLQEALVQMYPDTLILSFDRGMLYNHLIHKITQRNQVPLRENNTLGPYVCVPYGDIFKRWVLPNTVTKAFHAERYYLKDLRKFEVAAYPGYLHLINQGSILKSFKRPLILVDDILDKGNRLMAFEEILEGEDLKIEVVFAGVVTDRGKEKFKVQKIPIEGAYEIPEVRAWYNEGDVYPFIGGDGLKTMKDASKDILYSINMILPFVYPHFVKDVPVDKWYEFSKICLENTLDIFIAIEEAYLESKGKHLTLEALNEVMIIPRWPDIGIGLNYDIYEKPSLLIKNLIEKLDRIKHGYE